MSLWGAFSGGDARRWAQDQRDSAMLQNRTGYNNNRGYQQAGYTSAVNRLTPYAQAGAQGQTAYNNLLGLNGAAAQGDARSAYSGWNPYLQGDMDAASQSVARRMAAQGMTNSGLNALAQQEATRRLGTQDFYNYNEALRGLGQQGYSASNVLAGLDTGNANNMIGIENQFRNAQNGANSTFYQQQNQANMAGLQNTIGLGATIAQLAMGMPPTAMGSIGGNNALSYANGGSNQMQSAGYNNGWGYFGGGR